MEKFSFKIPQEIIFGKGSLEQVTQILNNHQCDNVFLISDPGLKHVGLVDWLEQMITKAGIGVTDFIDVQPNPTIDIVQAALKKYQDSGAKCIIALGGGSPMDVAKAVGLLATYGGNLTDYAGAQKVPGPTVPLIAIPTTAGTGSEVTASSVITDAATNYKMAIISHYLTPTYAVLDPELIMSLPAGVAAACGVDAFIHALEAYLSKAANTFTDAMAEKAMELIGRSIRSFVASRDNEDAACDMMLGSTLAGIAFAWAKLGNVHAMSHPVSGFFHVAHGVANAILLPAILDYNALADRGRYRVIYNYITNGEKAVDSFTPDMLGNAFRKLNQELGIPAALSEVGVTEDKIPEMAADTMKSGNILTNPRQTTIQDVEMLYRQLM